MLKKPNVWKAFTEHLEGSHKNLLRMIDKHTDMIIKLQKKVRKLESKTKVKEDKEEK